MAQRTGAASTTVLTKRTTPRRVFPPQPGIATGLASPASEGREVQRNAKGPRMRRTAAQPDDVAMVVLTVPVPVAFAPQAPTTTSNAIGTVLDLEDHSNIESVVPAPQAAHADSGATAAHWQPLQAVTSNPVVASGDRHPYPPLPRTVVTNMYTALRRMGSRFGYTGMLTDRPTYGKCLPRRI